MNGFLKNNYEKVIVAVAIAAVTLSVVWTWRKEREFQARDKLRDTQVHLIGSIHVPAIWRMPAPDLVAWPKASEQSAGSGWLYELFTPPVIYYNAGARSFAVTPAWDPAAESEEAAGAQPLNVKPGLFRLQLVGYFGPPDNYLLAFVSPGAPETLLARVGRHFEQLDLTLKSFEVKKVPVEHSEPWPVYEVAGFAIFVDERTGAEVVLDSRTRKQVENQAGPALYFSPSHTPGVANNGP